MRHILVRLKDVGRKRFAVALCGPDVPLGEAAHSYARVDCPECRKLKLEELREKTMGLGCGDSCCACRRPGGQTTNGGCRCDHHQLHKASVVWRNYALLLETEVRR